MNTSTVVIILLILALGLYYFTRMQNSAHSLDIVSFKEKIQKEPGVIIDVRTPDEHANGHLKNTDYNLNVMSGEFEQKLETLDKDETYYLYCRTGNRSGKAARLMKKQGFEKVYNIGGFRDLVNSGFEEE